MLSIDNFRLFYGHGQKGQKRINKKQKMKKTKDEESMLSQFPRVKTAWEAFGCPPVRRRLANDEFEAALTVTPEMVAACKRNDLLTERNPFADDSSKFNVRNVDILAGQILRDGWISGHKEICVDRERGKIVAANHTLLAVEAAGVPITVTARFGCDPRVESADGIGTQAWSTGARIREPDIFASTAFAHFRIHHGVNRPPDKQLAAWIEANRKYLNKVLAKLPKTERGSVQPGFKQAALMLALVEACARADAKLKDYTNTMTDFLDTLEDSIEGNNSWSKLLRDWVITHARGHSNKEKVYGAAVSILKRHLTGETFPAKTSAPRPQIREKSRWEDSLSVYPEHNEAEKLSKSEPVVAVARSLAKRTRSSVREKWVARITNAIFAEHGTGTPEKLEDYLKLGKAVLVKAEEVGRKLAKNLTPFSERSAIRFILRHRDDPTLDKFMDKHVQKVVIEDWRMVCLSQDRLDLRWDLRPTYDFEWLEKRFDSYVNQGETQAVAA